MLRLMGIPRIEGQATRLPDKGYVLLAMLLLDRRAGLARSEAASLLWPDASQHKAFANLRQLLAAISKWQRAGGIALLDTDRSTIALAAAAPAADVQHLLDARVPDSGAAIIALVEQFGDSFLSGIEVAESDLSRWIDGQREALRMRFADLLIAAGEAMVLPELETAFAHALQAAGLDERLVRARMANLAGLGRDREAAAVFRRLENELRRDMDAEPELETRALMARIQARPLPALALADGSRAAAGTVTVALSALPKIILLPPAEKPWANAVDIELARCLVDDITLQLCRRREFSMFAPHTARQLVGQEPLVAVAPFGVDYLVTTSIFPGTRQARLAFSLLDARSQAILSADEVPLVGEQLLSWQESVAERLAGSIAGHVAQVEMGHFRATGAASAYVRFLLGSALVQNTDLSKLRRARQHFVQSLRLSPDYVPALAALARTLSIEWLLLGRTDRDLLHEAQRLAHRAVQLDPFNAVGYRELGHASLYLGALEESESHFGAALERAPNHADLLVDRADILVHGSRAREAKPLIEKAFMLNPLAPDDYRWVGGSVEFFLENYEGALSLLLSMQDQAMVDRLIAASAAMAGDLETAKIHRQRWMSRYPDFRLKDFGTFMPHRAQRDVDHFVTALAAAGFE